MDSDKKNLLIEQSLEESFSGNTEAIETFLREMLAGPLFAPNRYQSQPLSDAPQYPNDLFSLLALQSENRVIVPVFSDPEKILSWCGLELSYQTLKGLELFSRIPEEWWVCLNPGGSVEKEISPWEIQLLQSGSESIPELVTELTRTPSITPPVYYPGNEDSDLKDIKTALLHFASNEEQVESLYLAREKFEDDGTPKERVVIGLVLQDSALQEFQAMREKLQDTIAPLFIGQDPPRILGDNAILIAPLLKISPIFKR